MPNGKNIQISPPQFYRSYKTYIRVFYKQNYRTYVRFSQVITEKRHPISRMPFLYLEMSGGGTRYESAGGLLHPAAVSYGEVGARKPLFLSGFRMIAY